MEARSILGTAPNLSIDGRIAQWLARLVAAILIAGLFSSALMLLARRVMGGLGDPLSGLTLVLTGAIAAIVAAGARLLVGSQSNASRGRAVKSFVWFVPCAAVIALAAAISLPGSSTWALALLWFVVVGEEAWAWWRWQRAGARSSARRTSAKHVKPRRERELSLRIPDAPPSFTSDAVQQFVRTRLAADVDRIEGWLKTVLQPHERNVALHVAFCPAFESVPEFTVIQAAGPDVRIKPVQLLAYGVRLELKLVQPSDEQSPIVVHFVAEHRPKHQPEA